MQISFGESHKVVGGHPSLGNWDVGNAPQMQWNDGNVWTLEVQLPEGSDIESKVISNLQLCMPDDGMLPEPQDLPCAEIKLSLDSYNLPTAGVTFSDKLQCTACTASK